MIREAANSYGEDFIDSEIADYSSWEEFIDSLNTDGSYNIWEEFTDSNNNSLWDEGEEFTDKGNGIWDDRRSNGIYYGILLVILENC